MLSTSQMIEFRNSLVNEAEDQRIADALQKFHPETGESPNKDLFEFWLTFKLNVERNRSTLAFLAKEIDDIRETKTKKKSIFKK